MSDDPERGRPLSRGRHHRHQVVVARRFEFGNESEPQPACDRRPLDGLVTRKKGQLALRHVFVHPRRIGQWAWMPDRTNKQMAIETGRVRHAVARDVVSACIEAVPELPESPHDIVRSFRSWSRTKRNVRLAVLQACELRSCDKLEFDLGMGEVELPYGGQDQWRERGERSHDELPRQLTSPTATASCEVVEHLLGACSDLQHVLACFRQRISACVTLEEWCAEVLLQEIKVSVDCRPMDPKRLGCGTDGSVPRDHESSSKFVPVFHAHSRFGDMLQQSA